jgi:hypothetical protein
MTPKEKAEELFNKMDMIIYTDQDSCKRQCVECAIEGVDEILNVLWRLYDNQNTSPVSEIIIKAEIDFWEQVKKELQKI